MNNWIRLRVELPEPDERVWLGSIKNQIVVRGYYSKSMNSFFDERGSGVACSHWMRIEKPAPPSLTPSNEPGK